MIKQLKSECGQLRVQVAENGVDISFMVNGPETFHNMEFHDGWEVPICIADGEVGVKFAVQGYKAKGQERIVFSRKMPDGCTASIITEVKGRVITVHLTPDAVASLQDDSVVRVLGSEVEVTQWRYNIQEEEDGE